MPNLTLLLSVLRVQISNLITPHILFLSYKIEKSNSKPLVCQCKLLKPIISKV